MKITIRKIDAFLVESDNPILEGINFDWPSPTVDQAFQRCADAILHEKMPIPADASDEWWERYDRVGNRLARLLAYWNRDHVIREVSQ